MWGAILQDVQRVSPDANLSLTTGDFSLSPRRSAGCSSHNTRAGRRSFPRLPSGGRLRRAEIASKRKAEYIVTADSPQTGKRSVVAAFEVWRPPAEGIWKVLSGESAIFYAQERRVGADVWSQEFDHLDKISLHRMADGLLSCNNEAKDRCVKFMLAETRGSWHGRARAIMCRRLKHCDVGHEQRRQLVDCIMNRLVTGDFSEQFRDQLRLAIHLEPERAFMLAHNCFAKASKVHIRRLAAWVIEHEESDHAGD